MGDLEKYSQKIDKLLGNKDFKGAINYVTSLKSSGANPQDITFLQVYISKNMDLKKPKSKNKSTFENENELEQSELYQLQSPHVPTNYGKIQQKSRQSQPNLLSRGQTKIQSRSSSTESDGLSTARQPALTTYETSQQISLGNENNIISQRSCIKSIDSTRKKQPPLSIKLPTLSSLDLNQYESLKKNIKVGLNQLESQGQINQKYILQNAYLEAAQHFQNEKKYDKAIFNYDKANIQNSTNINTIIDNANCHRMQGNCDVAMDYYDYANSLDPSLKQQVSLLFNQATTLKSQRKSKESIDLYSKVGLLDPSNSNIFFNKALTQYNIGEIDEAIDSYSKVIKSCPSDQSALLNKGFALREIGEFGQAVENFKSAAEVKAKTAREYLRKGNAFFQIDKLKESLESYQKAIQLDNNLYEAHLNMGVVLNQLGNTKEELKCYGRVLSIHPTDIKALYNKALSLREQGEIEESLNTFNEVLKQDSKMIDALINKGTIFYITEKYEESIKILQEALVIDKGSLLANIHLGECYRMIKEKDKAMTLYQNALKLNPNSSEIYFAIGETFRECMNLKMAFKNYSKAIELNPIDTEAIFQRGRCLLAVNEIDNGSKCFSLCIKFNIQDQPALIAKGIALMMKGQIKQAIQSFDQAQAVLTNNVDYEIISQIFKAQALRSKSKESSIKKATDSYLHILNKIKTKYSVKFSAYKGLSCLQQREIIFQNKQFLTSQQNKSSELYPKLPGSQIDDAYFQLLCYLTSEIEKMTIFTTQELKILNEGSCSELSMEILFKYLNIKKKQGIGSLGHGGGKHLIFLILSYLYIAFKQREKKEFDESIIYFDFIMNLDKELELYCRYHSLLSYLHSSQFALANKKFNIPLDQHQKKCKSFDIFTISFEKENIIEETINNNNNNQKSRQDKVQQSQAEHQKQENLLPLLPSSLINRMLLDKYEKEICCRKVMADQFMNNKERYLNSFALQNLLNHKNIQKINFMYTDADENAFFIEPFHKNDLRSYLNKNLVSQEQRLNILLQICTGLEYLHSNRIIHNSLEPKNILIKEQDGTTLNSINGITIQLTNLSKSRVILKTYHQSFSLYQDSDNQMQHFLSAVQPVPFSAYTQYDQDVKLQLSEDIYALGIIFQSLLIKISQSDRLINNMHRKGLQMSLQMHKIISAMLNKKATKRPDIQNVIETIQFEIFSTLIYSASSITSNSSQKDLVVKNSMRSIQISHPSLSDNHVPEIRRPSFNIQSSQDQSAQSIYQLQIFQQQAAQESIDTQVEQQQGNELLPQGRNKKQNKKQIQYQQFAQELQELRDSFKTEVVFSIQQNSDDQYQDIQEKISKILNISYYNIDDLSLNNLFISSLNKYNLSFLTAIFTSISDCSKKELLHLIERLYKSVQLNSAKQFFDGMYQYSQHKLFYRITNKGDPDKFRHNLLQKNHLKELYSNISSVFFSDSIELIESNKLRPLFLEQLNMYAFYQLKRNLGNFNFNAQISIKKRKQMIIDKFVQIISKLNLPSSDIDKIAKDLVIHTKLLQVLKFEGYLQDLGQGVNDLLFLPLREFIDKMFTFCKIECSSITDHQLIPIIKANQYYQERTKAFVRIISEIDSFKELKQSDYFSNPNKKRQTSTSLQISSTKKLQGGSQIFQKNLTKIEGIKAFSISTTDSKSQQQKSFNLIPEEPSMNTTHRKSFLKLPQNDKEKSNSSLLAGDEITEKKSNSESQKVTNDVKEKSKSDVYQLKIFSESTSTQKINDNGTTSASFLSPIGPTSHISRKSILLNNSANIKQSKELTPLPQQSDEEMIFSNNKNLYQIILEEANFHRIQLKQLKKSFESKEQKDDTSTIQSTNGKVNTNNLKDKNEGIVIPVEKYPRRSKRETQKNLESSQPTQQQLAEIEKQAKNVAIQQSVEMQELIEQENYNLFIKSLLQDALYVEKGKTLPSTSTYASLSKQQPSINKNKYDSSLGHIPSEDEVDNKKLTNPEIRNTIKTVESSKANSQNINKGKRFSISSTTSLLGQEKNVPSLGLKSKIGVKQIYSLENEIKSSIGTIDHLFGGNDGKLEINEIFKEYILQNGYYLEKAIILSKMLSIKLEDLTEIFHSLSVQL